MSDRTDEHRALRELLGAYALGHLASPEVDAVRAHLDGCAECRAELAELEPVARALGSVDPSRFATQPAPPADLGGRIRQAVADERVASTARASSPAAPVVRLDAAARAGARRGRPRRTAALLAVAAAVVVLAVGSGLVGRATAPEAPVAAPAAQIPYEPITLVAASETAQAGTEDVDVAKAGLVPHTWGVELRMVAVGFPEGESFRAWFRESDTGLLTPAGEFLGTGTNEMTCNLQSAVLRDDVKQVVVTDSRGYQVLTADL
ncbi:MAG: anti-sigma factor [Nocardioides sp.]|nr:anti-sigma factor [Nocardioides sp.]